MTIKHPIYKDNILLGYIKNNEILSYSNYIIGFIKDSKIYFTNSRKNEYIGYIDKNGNLISIDAKLLLSFYEKNNCYYDLEGNWSLLLEKYSFFINKI